MSERLEDIKKFYTVKRIILKQEVDEDIQWLIEQAERVEELENGILLATQNALELYRNNQRHKQALQFYADENNYDARFGLDIFKDIGDIARQVLKGESQ